MAAKMKAVFGEWSEIGPSTLNRILKPYGVRLIQKRSKDWGTKVSITAHPVEGYLVMTEDHLAGHMVEAVKNCELQGISLTKFPAVDSPALEREMLGNTQPTREPGVGGS